MIHANEAGLAYTGKSGWRRHARWWNWFYTVWARPVNLFLIVRMGRHDLSGMRCTAVGPVPAQQASPCRCSHSLVAVACAFDVLAAVLFYRSKTNQGAHEKNSNSYCSHCYPRRPGLA